MSNKAKNFWNIIFLIALFCLSWFLFELSYGDNEGKQTLQVENNKKNNENPSGKN